MSISAPQQVSAVQGVADELRAAIHRGDLSAASRLPPERELALQLGVSRITLREAIRILVEEGYLVARRGSRGGTFVTELEVPYRRWLARMRDDIAEFEDMLEFRIAVERRAARLAAVRRTDDDLLQLEDALEQLRRATDRAGYRSADHAFHRGLARAARSPRLGEAIAVARGELFLHTDHLIYAELIGDTLTEHRRVLDAVRDGDAERAAVAMEAHIEGTRQGLRALLLGDPGPDPPTGP
ncbi:MAG: FCD domain-containing protein [Kineosporiaceae bacterium]